MDTKTIIVTLVCAVLGSSALTTVVNAVVGAIQKKRARPQRRRSVLQRSTKSSGKCRSIRTSSIWQFSG